MEARPRTNAQPSDCLPNNLINAGRSAPKTMVSPVRVTQLILLHKWYAPIGPTSPPGKMGAPTRGLPCIAPIHQRFTVSLTPATS
ncbi:MAG: hypothetical protein LBK01_05810, partial [Burkholderiaceae bacterium]|nr:hypothetical protein [Burkholderiaceae bacterium]